LRFLVFGQLLFAGCYLLSKSMTNQPENPRPRVLSGMRPTGKLHLGNYVGALQNWVKLQDSHDCFFFVADWHALTTDYDDTSRLANSTLEVVLDFGLDEVCKHAGAGALITRPPGDLHGEILAVTK